MYVYIADLDVDMTTKCTITLTLPPLYDSMAQQFEVFKPFGSEQVTQLSNNT